MDNSRPNKWILFLAGAVFLLAIFFSFYNLGSKPFWDYDEAIYANVMHDTEQSGEIFTLSYRGSPWFEKPPLYFWLSIEANKIFNSAEFGYRFVASLLGLVSVLLVTLIVYELTGDVLVALVAGAVLLTTGPFIEASRQVRLDIPVVSTILFSIYCFLKAQKNPVWFLGIGASVAIGILFKSVVALLVLPFFFFWSLFYKKWSWLKNKFLWLGAVLGILILLPWHVYETMKLGKAFWDDYFFYHVLGRFENNIIGGSTTSLDYIKFFFGYGAPWTLLFLAIVIWLSTKYKEWKKEAMKPMLVFAFSGLSIFLLFIIASTKIAYYLLPVYPFVAIVVALFVKFAVDSYKKYNKTLLAIGVVCLVWGFVSMSYFVFHKYSGLQTNDIISKEESVVGEVLAKNTSIKDVYTYQYDYWDTIEYYSGHKTIKQMTDDQVLDHQFFLVVPTSYMKWHSFPEELMNHLEVQHSGQVITLYKFKL